MTDRIQLAAVVERLIYGSDTTFDAEDARTLDQLLPAEARTGFFGQYIHLNFKARISGRTQGFAAGVGNVRIPDDMSFEFDSRGRRIVRAGQWKLCRSGRDIEIEQVMDTESEKGVLIRYRQHEPTAMLRQVDWQFGFIRLGAYAYWKQPRSGEPVDSC
jgi:hypothetical protein